MLILSPNAGAMTPEIEERLRSGFSDHLVIDFDPDTDFRKSLSPRASVVVAGGDGTVEFVVSRLADTRHPVGIIPLGTYNNLGLALGLPTELEGAIAVAREGQMRPVTLGRVNRKLFIEACAIGLFGEAIVLGDAFKDRQFGNLGQRLKQLVDAKPFQYELAGDLQGSGTAMSLVFSNTSSIGSQLPIGDSNPADPYLEFSVHVGRTRTDIVGRALASVLLDKHAEEGSGQVFRFNRLEVKTDPRVNVYADNKSIGRTPATITAEVSALKVRLPK